MKMMMKIMNKLLLINIFILFGCSDQDQNILLQNMVFIPSGEFYMGTDSASAFKISNQFPELCDFQWFKDQFPKHRVYIDSFYIDKYEVTFGDYIKYITETKYESKGIWKKNYDSLLDTSQMKKILSEEDFKKYLSNPDHVLKLPVYGVTWEDANNYAKWKGKRLPSEAEWEYVAKGGKEDLEYPWGMQFMINKSNIQNQGGPKPVGSFPSSFFGIYDLGGNVQEWCEDFYDSNYYRLKINKNPKGPINGDIRVVRGGSWLLNGRFYSRSATRVAMDEASNLKYLNYIGFRCAISIDR